MAPLRTPARNLALGAVVLGLCVPSPLRHNQEGCKSLNCAREQGAVFACVEAVPSVRHTLATATEQQALGHLWSAGLGHSAVGPAERRPHVAVGSLGAPLGALAPLAARPRVWLLPLLSVGVMLALVTAVRRFDDTRLVKQFVSKFTNIELVDAPLPPQPLAFECTRDGEAITQALPEGEKVKWYVKKDSVFRRILLHGGLGLGESYMDGDWETTSIEQLCSEFLKLEDLEKGGAQASKQRMDLGVRAVPFYLSCMVGMLKARFLPSNTRTDSRKNIAAHYDISTKLYKKMLGPTMQYSCAYFCRPGMSVDEAERAKMHLVAKKLDLRPGMRVLDLGCGYGSMAHLLASEYGVHVTGVSLSKDQVEFAHENFAHPNVDIRLQDYRTVEGTYDRVYSVGIYEHIGRQFYKTYFDKCWDLLKDDGIMLIHTIGWQKSGKWNPNTFMFTYIFPGAELPTMGHFAEKFTERWHLEDWQSIGKSYPRTGRCWLANLGSWEGLEEFDDRFRRMWWYYIHSCCSSFEIRRTKVWQLVYTKTASGRHNDCHHIRAPDPVPA